MMTKACLWMILCLLPGCYMMEDLENVGKAPTFTPQPSLSPLRFKEAPGATSSPQNNHQSLWGTGNKSFFRDQRAHQVGDILTVKINMQEEKASLENGSERKRENIQELLNISNFLGANLGATPAINATSNPTFKGGGKTDRKETLKTSISVMVKEVLPNGNMIIEGRQEIRMNYEIREIFISGIVRPQDISDANEINWNHIAEARIGYGGRGQIMQFNQPAYGQQILDILSPL